MSQLPIVPCTKPAPCRVTPGDSSGLAVSSAWTKRYLELARASGFCSWLAEAIAGAGCGRGTVFGTLVSVFSDEPVRDYNGAHALRRRALRPSFAPCCRGVALAPSLMRSHSCRWPFARRHRAYVEPPPLRRGGCSGLGSTFGTRQPVRRRPCTRPRPARARHVSGNSP